jgi:ABC-type amino acid transport substrate-binding protein
MRNWQWVNVIVAWLLCVSLHAAPHCNDFDPSYDDIAALKKTGVLRIAVHDQEPPASWRDNQGQWRGHHIKLTQSLAQQLGVQARFVMLRYHNEGELINLIKTNQVDLAAPEAAININSLAYLMASTPYEFKHLALLFPHTSYDSRRVATILKTINQNTDVIGTLNNKQELHYLSKHLSHAKPIHYRTTDALVRALQKNRVNAIIGNYRELSHWLNKHPARHLNYQLLKIPGSKEGVSLVTGPQHWRLLQWVNIAIQERKAG